MRGPLIFARWALSVAARSSRASASRISATQCGAFRSITSYSSSDCKRSTLHAWICLLLCESCAWLVLPSECAMNPQCASARLLHVAYCSRRPRRSCHLRPWQVDHRCNLLIVGMECLRAPTSLALTVRICCRTDTLGCRGALPPTTIVLLAFYLSPAFLA